MWKNITGAVLIVLFIVDVAVPPPLAVAIGLAVFGADEVFPYRRG